MICYLWNDTLNELHICLKHLPMIVFIIAQNFVYFCYSSIVWLSFSLHNSLIHFYLLSLCIESLHISRDLLSRSCHCDRLQVRVLWYELLVRTSRGNRDFESWRSTLLRWLSPRVSKLILQVIILRLFYFVQSKLVCFESSDWLTAGKVSRVCDIFSIFIKQSRRMFIELRVIHHHLKREWGGCRVAVYVNMRLQKVLKRLQSLREFWGHELTLLHYHHVVIDFSHLLGPFLHCEWESTRITHACSCSVIVY